MANVLSGNTWYIDTAHSSANDDLSGSYFVYYVVVTATSSSAVLELGDATTNDTKLKIHVASAGTPETFDFSAFPVRFPNGIKVKTLTNAVATLVGNQSKGS